MLTRAITGIIFVVAMIGGIASGRPGVSILAISICALCCFEFFQIHGLSKSTSIAGSTFIACLLLPFVLLPDLPINMGGILASTWLIGLLPTVYILVKRGNKPAYQLFASSIVYILLPCILFAFLGNNNDVNLSRVLIFMLIIIWSNDSGAYFFGKYFGRSPFFKTISPNKTLEGFIGGFITALIVAYALSYFEDRLSSVQWVGLGFAISISATVGDLLESRIKRLLLIKDTGGFLPGHGGFLDRFDAFLIALPAGALYLLVISVF